MSTQPDTMREAFEAYVLSKPGANSITIRRRDFPGSDRIGEYISLSVEFGWLSWQAATEHAARVCERLGPDSTNAECADAIRKSESLEGEQ